MSDKITLSPEAVEAYKQLMTNPQAHGLNMPALSEIFEPAEAATAKHLLFDQYIEKIQKPLPKMFFYIIMDELYAESVVSQFE